MDFSKVNESYVGIPVQEYIEIKFKDHKQYAKRKKVNKIESAKGNFIDLYR